MADPDWFTMNEEDEKGAGTGTGTGPESIYDGMASSSGVVGVNSELKKLKKEMDSLRKVRSRVRFLVALVLIVSLDGLASCE